jgi:hypothetical protein
MRGSKCVMRNRQWTGEWPGSYGEAMASTSVVETARQSLGPVGAYLPIPFTGAPPIDQQRVPVPSELSPAAPRPGP